MPTEILNPINITNWVPIIERLGIATLVLMIFLILGWKIISWFLKRFDSRLEAIENQIIEIKALKDGSAIIADIKVLQANCVACKRTQDKHCDYMKDISEKMALISDRVRDIFDKILYDDY